MYQKIILADRTQSCPRVLTEGSPAVHKSQENFGGFSSEAGARVAAIYLTFVETCKLMKKTALDFFKGFFGMTTSGRTDYELIVQELLC